MRQRGWRALVKRTVDIVGAGSALVACAPVILVVGAAIKWAMPGPTLFRQKRPGRDGRSFEIFKFRTMSEESDSDGRLLSDDQRLTQLGKFLRATSLDELPQLFNVLRGDISFVGPRPLLTKYLPLYDTNQARRHDVMPGITGWAQIHGRNAIAWDEKLALDVWYVDNWSLVLDMRIAVRTCSYVLKREGITRGAGFATTEEFTGSKQKPATDDERAHA